MRGAGNHFGRQRRQQCPRGGGRGDGGPRWLRCRDTRGTLGCRRGRAGRSKENTYTNNRQQSLSVREEAAGGVDAVVAGMQGHVHVGVQEKACAAVVNTSSNNVDKRARAGAAGTARPWWLGCGDTLHDWEGGVNYDT